MSSLISARILVGCDYIAEPISVIEVGKTTPANGNVFLLPNEPPSCLQADMGPISVPLHQIVLYGG